MRRLARGLGIAATTGMFVVLVMGATVTNTGSEQGCGHSWPLCHGRLIPQFAVQTAIEFSHRAVVGIESILILALAALTWQLYGRRREVRILVPLMVGFLFLQAGLGAWAVMYPQVAAILALHFGVSLIAFASVLLTTAFLFEVDGIAALIRRPLPLGFRYAAWGVTAYTYVVVYLGAFVRHVDADESCRGWPLCNGHVIPAFTDKVAVAFTHRVAAAILIAAIVALALWSRRYRARRPDIFRACLMAVGLVVLQAGSGAIVAFTGVDIFSALAHAALVGLLFGSLVYLCSHLVGFGSVEAAPERSAILTAPQAEAAGTPQ